MGNAIRVKNTSNADRELFPGSGFIPAGQSVDFPIDTYREQHERYAKALLDNDPPLIQVEEVDSDQIDDKRVQEERRKADEKRAEEQRQIELGKKVEDTVKSVAPSGAVGASAQTSTERRSGHDPESSRRR